MCENEQKIILCGKCQKWQFDYFTSGKNGNEPWGICQMSYSKEGQIPKDASAVSQSSYSSINAWLATKHDHGCVAGEDSGQNTDWQSIANFRIGSLSRIIASPQQ